MKRCPHCGGNVPTACNQCTYCGKDIRTQPIIQNMTESTEESKDEVYTYFNERASDDIHRMNDEIPQMNAERKSTSYRHTIIAAIIYYIVVFFAAGYHSSNIVGVALAPVFYLVFAGLMTIASCIVFAIAWPVALIGYTIFGLEKPFRAIKNINMDAILYIVFMVALIGMPIYVLM